MELKITQEQAAIVLQLLIYRHFEYLSQNIQQNNGVLLIYLSSSFTCKDQRFWLFSHKLDYFIFVWWCSHQLRFLCVLALFLSEAQRYLWVQEEKKMNQVNFGPVTKEHLHSELILVVLLFFGFPKASVKITRCNVFWMKIAVILLKK